MDCLELDIHQLILSDFAENIGHSKNSANTQSLDVSIDLVTSQVETRAVSDQEQKEQQYERVFMSYSRVQCNIGFAELAVNLPNAHVAETVPVLIDILRDIPHIDFDRCLAWDEWSPPDQSAFATVSALLRIASLSPTYRADCITAIENFVSDIVAKLQSATSSDILSQFAPCFHGFYRAIISISFPWSIQEWTRLAQQLNKLFLSDVVEGLNRLLVDVLRGSEQDPEGVLFVQTFLARYISRSRPLSGYFIVCCVIEAQWTILTQALIPSAVPLAEESPEFVEAEAANRAWKSLVHEPVSDEVDHDELFNTAAQETFGCAMQSFSKLLLQIEEMDTQPSEDSYAWETMSESLKLAAVCSRALGALDNSLFSRLQLLLSEDSPVSDNLVQEAALKATAVIVRKFPEHAAKLAAHLRKFVTSPLPIFEFELGIGTYRTAPLVAAARCLALCVDLAPGDDLIMSYMYSLLNQIPATSKEGFGSLASPVNEISDASTLYSLDSGLRGLTEDEKRLVGMSTISVVTRLALEFHDEEVTRLTVSMLLQRLRSAEPAVEAAIAYNLVDLALKAPESSFVDIIKAFSVINRSANRGDQRFSNNQVLAAQTRLAQELCRRPELYEAYLTELLGLFCDKGVAIQNSAIVKTGVKVDDLIEELASLLLPIDALLCHADLHISANPPSLLTTLFRNVWFLCVLFQFTSDDSNQLAMSWKLPALARIAARTPPIVLEEAHDTIVSDLEYNPVIRKEYAEIVIHKHRDLLIKHISLRHSEIRGLLPGQIVFLLAMHDIERFRSGAGLPASLATYFVNNSLNKSVNVVQCMDAVAEKVIRECVIDLNGLAAKQALPDNLSEELRSLLIASTHRVSRARDVASKYLNRLITSFPSLTCNPPLVFAALETLTLLRRACDNEFLNEDAPTYTFSSDRMDLTLQLTDDYAARNEMLSQLLRDSNGWFELALGRAPVELHATLQSYLSLHQAVSLSEPSDLGPSVALEFVKAFGPIDRRLASFSKMLPPRRDRARVAAAQLASKAYFGGETSGFRLSRLLDPTRGDTEATPQELELLLNRMAVVTREVAEKKRILKPDDLKRLLFRCASIIIDLKTCHYELLHYLVALPFETFTSTAISAGVEVWSWVISERPQYEVVLLSELTTSWIETIEQKRGIFSTNLNYADPFYHSVEYSPSDGEYVQRNIKAAKRQLIPHTLILQLLFSRLQAARYRKLGIMHLLQRLALKSVRAHAHMSTHPLAREARFSLLLFSFEVLRSSYLDMHSESQLRNSLYRAAFAWFTVRPQWSYGANRIQIDTDVKILSEFLSYLQTDKIRGFADISSFIAIHAAPSASYYQDLLKDINAPLRLLVENEMFRLSVWTNPTNDVRRGADYVGTGERVMTDLSWADTIRQVWRVDPAIAVNMAERFHSATVQNEVTRLVRSNTREVLDVPEALQFLIGERLDQGVRRDLKHLLLWAPIPPVMAITFFETRYSNDPLLLQYAHRVLEQHPVDLTFFFVPQVVQALRHDDLGYVAHFIFETAKISQLFCHQIIWNMKANCYKDDAAEVEDPMKPQLDRTTDLVVAALSGEAREFYDREFTFFNEVTSISGKLKPFIKKTKPEKKTKIDEEMAKIRVDVGVYLPSNPDGVVVDIDKKSGRPLQSHAKAPFMATFKVRKTHTVVVEDSDALAEDSPMGEVQEEYDVWQAAIFKVGDDCRQDMLALQIIAMFKNIFSSVGLTVYLFPYRVTATAPGCGVIDVVPNATSRDEMGRAKVNDLLDFFVAKYGGEDTVEFQHARLNFIQSMAAYSVACYILQIKDRHNGNIMIDGEGHIVHVDFGFLFDIGPGGVKFEPNSFKLTHEMVILMGGRNSQGYQLFQQLTVKAFLAIRPYADQLVNSVHLMLETGLPSFKGEPTIKRLRDRFALELNERQAADWMMAIVRNAHENVRSTAYDEFQRLQNGIPYK
ncbi:atypical/PIKK/PI4K protein kinase [Irpex rosettiformis]|uniref:Atypical/PIKK/PI4K protein kinase n=1 Tax=Irpex rosettiformis TaxID=378272 RepID=A0ACB8TWN4_9APHY|nr:atypical/PIKK/PI4K protein kinase [Irpex rosettiformis]